MAGSRTIIGSALIPFRMVFLMWLAFVADFIYDSGLSEYGIVPRTSKGLIGILTSPLLHGNVMHILGNTIPVLFLGAILFFFYNKIASRVFALCYFLTGTLVWIFARSANHIGASGLIYGLAGFLVAYGFLRRDILSIAISVVVIALYGYLIYGIFPSMPWISWEAHLAGALVGIFSAVIFRNVKEF